MAKSVKESFPKYKELVKEMNMVDLPVGDPRRLDIIIGTMERLHRSYIKSLGFWGRMKYRIKRGARRRW